MTYAPQSISDLQRLWVSKNGTALGIVGDTSHQSKGTSYHLGKDDLLVGAYSTRTHRDRDGLTNAASAIDLGRLDGMLTELWAFSRWFAGQCKSRNPVYSDVREVIFWSPIRNRVVGWSDLAPDQWINDYGDRSHKTHTHISFYRDSERRAKTGMFVPYFPAVVVPPQEEDVILNTYLPGYVATVKKTANVRSSPTLSASSVLRGLLAPEAWVIIGQVAGAPDPDNVDPKTNKQWFVRWNGKAYEYTAFSNVTSLVAVGGDVAAMRAQIASLQAAVSAAGKAAAAAQNAASEYLGKIAAAKAILG